jgi:alkyl hydroperoxide reductase subunit F
MIYELLIIGGGPGGVAAGVYAARKKIPTLLIAEEFGGQSIVSADIQNWIGTPSLSGFDLAQNLEKHLRAQEDIEIVDDDRVTAVEDKNGVFAVRTEKGKEYSARRLLIASGSRRRKLGVPGEQELDGKGVVYCSTCDAPVFKGKTVAVVGGGNAGLEAVVDLLPYAEKIYLLEYGEALKGDQVTQDKITKETKVTTILRAKTERVIGNGFVSGLEYADLAADRKKTLDVQGVFVEIGAIPNAEFMKSLVDLTKFGEIVADPKTQRTSHPRIWAVGDVSDVLYKQNNISAGDAVKAVLNIADDLHRG